jgi:hypothetical protein
MSFGVANPRNCVACDQGRLSAAQALISICIRRKGSRLTNGVQRVADLDGAPHELFSLRHTSENWEWEQRSPKRNSSLELGLEHCRGNCDGRMVALLIGQWDWLGMGHHRNTAGQPVFEDRVDQLTELMRRATRLPLAEVWRRVGRSRTSQEHPSCTASGRTRACSDTCGSGCLLGRLSSCTLAEGWS